MNEDFRVLGIDPGDIRIGLAISDLTGTIANPLSVIIHEKREIDAKKIFEIAIANDVKLIIVGIALDEEGELSPSGRKAKRLADMIKTFTTIPIELWDESESTNLAQEARKKMGIKRKNRKGHMDDLAATVILQNYLDANVQKIQPQSVHNQEK